MATNGIGAQYPTGSDEFAPHLDIEGLADSLVGRVVVPVANATAAGAVAAAVAPSASNPLYVHRADAKAGSRLEVTEDGTTWRAVGSAMWASEQTAPNVAGGATTNVTFNFPAGLFTTPPICLAGIKASSSFTAGTGTATTSSVGVTVRNITGSMSNVTVVLFAVVVP